MKNLTAIVLWYDIQDKNGILECEDGNRRYFDSDIKFKKGDKVIYIPTPWLDPNKFAIRVEKQ